MKILLLGDASNYHYCLSTALTEMGHQVTVASHGSRWMRTKRNINLYRHQGRIGGAWLWLKLNTVLRRDLKGYDIVQICGTNFLELRAEKIKTVFDRIKRDNGRVFMTMLNNDSRFVDYCVNSDGLRYNDWKAALADPYGSNERLRTMDQWLSPQLKGHCDYIYDNVDGVVTALYEYHKACMAYYPAEKLSYGGIPVDMNALVPSAPRHDGPIRIMVACHKGREREKGIDRIMPVLETLCSENQGRVAIDFVQNLPFEEFRAVLSSAHIVVDQLYSYTPATTALMAMARGKVVVSGAENEYYDFIGEKALKPIVNADPNDLQALKRDLQELIDYSQKLQHLSDMGPQFVAKHNAKDVVAARFVDFWHKQM